MSDDLELSPRDACEDPQPPRVARVLVKLLHEGVPARVKYVGQWWYHTGRVGAIGEDNHVVAEYSTDGVQTPYLSGVCEGPDRVWYDGEGRFYPNPVIEMPAPRASDVP